MTQSMLAFHGHILNSSDRPDPHKPFSFFFIQNSVTESRLYQQMALTASTNAYSWSKWNSEIENEEKIVMQGQQHLQDEPLQEVHTCIQMGCSIKFHVRP